MLLKVSPATMHQKEANAVHMRTGELPKCNLLFSSGSVVAVCRKAATDLTEIRAATAKVASAAVAGLLSARCVMYPEGKGLDRSANTSVSEAAATSASEVDATSVSGMIFPLSLPPQPCPAKGMCVTIAHGFSVVQSLNCILLVQPS